MPIFFNPRINWSESVTESFQFVTQVFTTATGREVREARRQWPRWGYRLPLLYTRDEFRQLMALMVRHRRQTVLVPAPSVFFRMTGTTSAASDFIALPSTARPSWLVIGAHVSILGGLYRVRAINGSGFNVDTIVVGNPVGVDADTYLLTHNGLFLLTDTGESIITNRGRGEFPAGSGVFFVMEARLGSVQEIDFVTTRAGTGVIEVEAVPDQPVPYAIVDFPADTVHDGLPILGMGANWRERVNLSVDMERESFVSETGPESYYWQHDFVPRYWSYTYSGFGRDVAAKAIAFFVGKRGRARTFYAAAPASEITPVEGMRAGDASLTIRGRDHAFLDELNLFPQFLQFKTAYGVFRLRVQSAVEGAEQTVIQFTTGAPYILGLNDIHMIQPLLQSRFAEDKLEVEWYTTDVAEMTVKTKTLDYVSEA